MLSNTKQSYGLVSKLLHWAMALFISGLLIIGFYMETMGYSPLKLQVMGLHKSFGMLVLGLVVFRIVWHVFGIYPKGLSTHHPFEKFLAKAAHILLYLAMIGMPLTGWLMSSAGDFPVPFFGLFEVPDLVGKDEAVFHLMRNLHGAFAWALIFVIVLHVAGAVKHHFIDKDSTLARMSKDGLGLKGGVVLTVLAGVLLAISLVIAMGEEEHEHEYHHEQEHAGEQAVGVQDVEDHAQSVAQESSGWAIDHAASDIKFEVTQYGAPFTGQFEDFNGQIVFDPEDLENAHVRVEIDIASIKTGSADRDVQAVGAEWFDTDQYPRAVFESSEFVHKGSNRYEAKGDLTIRGVSVPVVLPFTLDIEAKDEGQQAIVSASFTLSRLAFGIGQGEWENTDAIGDTVMVQISLEALLQR